MNIKKLFFIISLVFGIAAIILWIARYKYTNINTIYPLSMNIIQIFGILGIKYSK